jgi:Tfp pilus assembly protein PilW
LGAIAIHKVELIAALLIGLIIILIIEALVFCKRTL